MGETDWWKWREEGLRAEVGERGERAVRDAGGGSGSTSGTAVSIVTNTETEHT